MFRKSVDFYMLNLRLGTLLDFLHSPNDVSVDLLGFLQRQLCCLQKCLLLLNLTPLKTLSCVNSSSWDFQDKVEK